MLFKHDSFKKNYYVFRSTGINTSPFLYIDKHNPDIICCKDQIPILFF